LFFHVSPFFLSSSFFFCSRCAVLEWRRPSAGLQPCTRVGQAGSTNAERRLPLDRGALFTSLPRQLALPRCSSWFLFERSAVPLSFICRELARGYRSTGCSCAVRQASIRQHPAIGGARLGGCPFSPCFSVVRSFLSVRLQAAVLASKSLCSVLIRCREYRFKQ
jgi:hypothetical protein